MVGMRPSLDSFTKLGPKKAEKKKKSKTEVQVGTIPFVSELPPKGRVGQKELLCATPQPLELHLLHGGRGLSAVHITAGPSPFSSHPRKK